MSKEKKQALCYLCARTKTIHLTKDGIPVCRGCHNQHLAEEKTEKAEVPAEKQPEEKPVAISEVSLDEAEDTLEFAFGADIADEWWDSIGS